MVRAICGSLASPGKPCGAAQQSIIKSGLFHAGATAWRARYVPIEAYHLSISPRVRVDLMTKMPLDQCSLLNELNNELSVLLEYVHGLFSHHGTPLRQV
jgi:hypothetical protein